jgi:hypothetical protein
MSRNYTLERLKPAIVSALEEMARLDSSKWRFCSAGNCWQRYTHIARYRYKSGRSKRFVTGVRYYCDEHADKFAKKYKVKTITEAPGR